jgi:hypothetical protein
MSRRVYLRNQKIRRKKASIARFDFAKKEMTYRSHISCTSMKKITIFSIFIFSAVFLVGSFFVGNIFAGSKTNSDYAGSIKKCLDAKKISQEK